MDKLFMVKNGDTITYILTDDLITIKALLADCELSQIRGKTTDAWELFISKLNGKYKILNSNDISYKEI